MNQITKHLIDTSERAIKAMGAMYASLERGDSYNPSLGAEANKALEAWKAAKKVAESP